MGAFMKIMAHAFLFLDFSKVEKQERRIFLGLLNAVNDLEFENFKSRGAIEVLFFESDDLGYSISFEGFLKFKLVFNITDQRYYFRYNERIIDVFVLKTWDDIDDWINGKQFNITDISQDEFFRGLKKNDS